MQSLQECKLKAITSFLNGHPVNCSTPDDSTKLCFALEHAPEGAYVLELSYVHTVTLVVHNGHAGFIDPHDGRWYSRTIGSLRVMLGGAEHEDPEVTCLRRIQVHGEAAVAQFLSGSKKSRKKKQRQY